MSVVSALSRWLIHTNRRENGAWTQRYELGRPASDTVAIESSCETGTTVRFLVDSDLVAAATVTVEQVGDVRGFPWLSIRATAE
jgi:topoisomerase-4 subunit B